MRSAVVLSAFIAVSCFAQQSGRSVSPGGHASAAAGHSNTAYGRGHGNAPTHGVNSGRRYSQGFNKYRPAAPVYIPVAVYGGYGLPYGLNYSDPASDQSAPPPPESTPDVIVNPDYVPDRANPMIQEVPDTQSDGQNGVESYQAPGPPPVDPSSDAVSEPDQPTIYLIAFTDHTIVPALSYWTDGNILKYVNMDHSINQASLDLVDRDLSRLLNEQRNMDFLLPAR